MGHREKEWCVEDSQLWLAPMTITACGSWESSDSLSQGSRSQNWIPVLEYWDSWDEMVGDALTLLLYYYYVCKYVCVLVAQLWQTHCDSVDCSPSRLLCPWDFLGKNTEVGCHFRLQRLFLTQGSNSNLLHCRQILYHLSHQESKLTVVHNTTTMHHCYCLEISMDRGTWHGFARCWPRLSTSASAHVLLLTSVVISRANANSPNPHQNQSSWWDHHPPFTNQRV